MRCICGDTECPTCGAEQGTSLEWLRQDQAEVQRAALNLCRGSYQRALIEGSEYWSGSTLRGSARTQNGASYARSRDALLVRLSNAMKTWVASGPHNRLILLLGEAVGVYQSELEENGISSDSRALAVELERIRETSLD